MWWVEGNLLFVEQTVPLHRATSHLLGVARSLYRMACTDWLWRTISFTAAGEKQSPTMLSERGTRGGTYRDFSTPP